MKKRHPGIFDLSSITIPLPAQLRPGDSLVLLLTEKRPDGKKLTRRFERVVVVSDKSTGDWKEQSSMCRIKFIKSKKKGKRR